MSSAPPASEAAQPPQDAHELAVHLSEGPAGRAVALLADELPDILHATWCAVLRPRGPPEVDAPPEVAAASLRASSFAGVATPWLPLVGPRRLDPASRAQGPRFRSSELRALESLARLADRLAARDTPAPRFSRSR